MASRFRIGLLGAILFYTQGILAQKERSVSTWLTDPSRTIFFQEQPISAELEKGNAFPTDPTIAIDERHSFQSIDGFGFALTGGSAQHLMRMSAAARTRLLKDLFDTDSNHIGASYLRVSIGASDLNDHVFSYDDLPAGQTDTMLTHFDLGPDRKDVVPILKEILDIDPAIRILGSPWSAPAWMKSNKDTRGGSLLPQYYSVYAKYLVQYILAMQQEGIGIGAITIQNEPLNPKNNPSMVMQAAEEGEFVKRYLGPAFERLRLDTKIIIYDHNCDRPDYPLSILHDPDTRNYIDGSAFHLYGGTIDTLTLVHEAYPDKNLYFTEQWVGGPGDFGKDIPEHIRKLIIGATRNWCKTVIEWNLAADSLYQPHTDRGGCDRCLGAVTIGGDRVQHNPAYYIIAHAAKFVRPGSVRIGSNSDKALPNVAFKTPGGKVVLIVLNNTTATHAFNIDYKNRRIHPTLNPGAVATYVMEYR
jgi:glucosylceramidase